MKHTQIHPCVSIHAATCAPNRRASGFTLAELVIVSSLIGLVVMASGTVMWQVSGARTRADRREAIQADADAALHTIVSAIANAYRPASDRRGLFVGVDEQIGGFDADSLRLLTISRKVIRPGRPESDLHEVEFMLVEGYEGKGLTFVKRTDPTFNVPNDKGGVVDRIAGGLISLDFEYFDGTVWQARWPESMGRLPAAVRVTIALTAQDRPGVISSYTRIVSLPLVPDPQSRGGGA